MYSDSSNTSNLIALLIHLYQCLQKDINKSDKESKWKLEVMEHCCFIIGILY